ncbi:MAG: DUF1308 domain-containing protein [Sulfobacillus sp.]
MGKDCADDAVNKLRRSRKITGNDIAIFSTGRQHRIRTMTRDYHFVCASKQQGLPLDAVVILSMTLTGY